MNDFFASLMLLGALSSGGQLPFWATAGQFGLMPEASGGLALVQLGGGGGSTDVLSWHWRTSFAANTYQWAGDRTTRFIPDEVFASVRWKALSLDAGIRHTERDFLAQGQLGSLSTTSGNIVWSTNARMMPGYSLTLAPVTLPFAKGKLSIGGLWGDYKMLDDRFLPGSLIHRMRAYMRWQINPRLSWTMGIDHFAQWGGEGGVAVTASNYLRVITGRSAGADGTLSDQINVIGDHGGAEFFRFDYCGDGWKLVFQHNKPYSDKSGMKFVNFPDGVNTLAFSRDERDTWVTDVAFELMYTRDQSGPLHESEVDAEGHHIPWSKGKKYCGGDNYFNHSSYRSGWTYYGRGIGTPLFFVQGTKNGTWAPGSRVAGIENNRVRAFHLGLSGKLFRAAPYKFMLTYSQNYGTYRIPYAGESAWQKPPHTVRETALHQVSAAFQGEIPFGKLSFLYGIYADKGSVLQDALGATLGLRYDL